LNSGQSPYRGNYFNHDRFFNEEKEKGLCQQIIRSFKMATPVFSEIDSSGVTAMGLAYGTGKSGLCLRNINQVT